MSETEKTSLSTEADAALTAFRHMSQSKQEYFQLLQEIDQKYKSGGSATIAENLHLEKLLKAHGDRVFAFNEAMAKVSAPEDREKLISLMNNL